MKRLNEYILENESVNEKLYEKTDDDIKVFQEVVKAMDKKQSGEGPGFVRELLYTLYKVTKTKTDPDVIKGAEEFLYVVKKS